MNKKKLKTIIALTLSFSYFNATFANSVKAFSEVIYKTQEASEVEYKKLIKSNLNLNPLNTEACENTSNHLVNGSNCILNTKQSFKVFLSENENGFLLSPTTNSDKKEFLLPTNSFLNEKSLILTPSKDIETLSLFFKDGQTISYSNLKKDSNYKLSSIDNLNQPDYVLIKYEDGEKVYKERFSFIKDTTIPSISNIKKAYTIDSSKQTLHISWEESDDNPLKDINYKKVLFNNTLLDIFKSDLDNSYYCDIDITNLSDNSTINILTCDSTYQISNQSISLELPKFDYSDKTLINSDINDAKYSIDFPFTDNIESVTVKSQEETFNLDSSNKTAKISIPKAGTYNVTFIVNLKNNHSYTINKKYIFDNKELILKAGYETKIHKAFDTNLSTDNAIVPCAINNNETIYYDGKTLDKNRYEFPLSILVNKDLEDLSITVNGNKVINNKIDFNSILNLNPGTNLISITASDKSGYVAQLNFTVETATKDYSFNLSSDAKLSKIDDTSYELNSNKVCDLNAKLIDYPDTLNKDKIKIEAFDIDKHPIRSIEQNILPIKSIPSNCSNIKINYLDKFNRLITTNVLVNIDTVNPIIKTKFDIPEYLNAVSYDNLKYVLEVKDDSLSKTREIKKVSDLTATTENTLSYQLSCDKDSKTLPLSHDKIKLKQDTTNKNISMDFTSALKDLNLKDGKYTLKCKYIDNVKNSSDEYSKTFVIDSKAPSITEDLVNPVYNEALYKDIISIKKEASSILFNHKKVLSIEDDNLEDFDYKIFKLENNSEVEVTDSTLNTSGDYVLFVSCKDKAGNEASLKTITFSLDCDVPKINENSNKDYFINGKYYYRDKSFVLSLYDNYMNFSQCKYLTKDTGDTNSVYASLTSSLDNSVNLFDINNCVKKDDKQLNFDINGLNLQDGEYKLSVKIIDKVGHVTTADYVIIVDRIAPKIKFENTPILTEGSTYYFKNNFISNFVVTDNTPLETITMNYSVNGKKYSSTADKFNEDLLGIISKLKADIPNPNEHKFNIVINGEDKAGNAFFPGGEAFKCRLVLDSNSPTTTIHVNDTVITGKKDKIFNTKPSSIRLVVNDSNLNIDNVKNDFKVRYLGTISNAPEKDVLSSSLINIELRYDDSIKGYVANIPYLGDGYYYIETSAKDYSENDEGTLSTFFTIDTTAVNSKIESSDGSFSLSKKHYNDSIKFSLNVAGHYSGFKTCKYSLFRDGVDVTKDYLTDDFNGVQKGGNISFSLPKNSSIEGNYTFKYSIVGNVGGENENTINFVIDKTAPTLSDFNLNMGNGKIVNNIYYTNALTANIKFSASDKYTDVDNLIKTVTINGSSYTLSDTSIPNNYISADGKYNLYFTLTDAAGNTSSYNYNVILDRVAPTLNVSGFIGNICPEDKEFYINKNITPLISVTDTNGEDLAARSITLDNLTYTSSTISSNGKRSYKVKVKDYAGNTSEFEKTFILDTVFPVISISDVVKNKYYNKDVLPKITVDDSTAKLSAYLNNSSYNSSVIKNDGIYELVITAIDRALNKSEVKIPFTIDKIAPIISIKGILENQVNGGSLTPLITTNEAQAVITSLLNGEEYLGFVITDSGKYNLIVRAVDLAGNTAQKVVSFILDSTLPQITVEGLEDGKAYTGSVKPIITASKDAKIELFLNGKPYDGSPITAIGEYELKVVATDKVSNKSEAIYKFSITSKDKTATSANSDPNTSSTKNINNTSAANKSLPSTALIVALIFGFFTLISSKIKKKKLSKVNKENKDTEK